MAATWVSIRHLNAAYPFMLRSFQNFTSVRPIIRAPFKLLPSCILLSPGESYWAGLALESPWETLLSKERNASQGHLRAKPISAPFFLSPHEQKELVPQKRSSIQAMISPLCFFVWKVIGCCDCKSPFSLIAPFIPSVSFLVKSQSVKTWKPALACVTSMVSSLNPGCPVTSTSHLLNSPFRSQRTPSFQGVLLEIPVITWIVQWVWHHGSFCF